MVCSKEDSHARRDRVSASSASRQPLLQRPLVLALLALLALLAQFQSVLPDWHRGAKLKNAGIMLSNQISSSTVSRSQTDWIDQEILKPAISPSVFRRVLCNHQSAVKGLSSSIELLGRLMAFQQTLGDNPLEQG